MIMKYLEEMAEKRILIIVPHPDDELNIAGIVINNHKNKDNIWILYTTNFDIYGKAEVDKRYKEVQKLKRYIGIPNHNILFLGFHVYDGTQNQYAYSLPRTTAVMEGELETEETLKRGIKRVIEEIKPDIIYAIDCDDHIDHKRTSVAVDNIANEFVRGAKHYSEIPLFFKGFAYATCWSSYNDFYEENNSTRCFENGQNTIAPYDWESRIRIPYIDNSAYSKFLSKCWLKGAYLCHRSQNIYSHISKCINSDQVLWKLETENRLIGCNVKLSSGTFDSIFDVAKRKNFDSKIEYYPGEWENIDFSQPVELEIHNVAEAIDSITFIFDVRHIGARIKVALIGEKQFSFEMSGDNTGIIKQEVYVCIPAINHIKIRFEGDIGTGYVVKRIFGKSDDSYEDVKITDANKQYLYKLYATKQKVELNLHKVFNSCLDHNDYTMEVINVNGMRILPNRREAWIYEYKKDDIGIQCLDKNRAIVDSIPIITDRKIYTIFLGLERIFYKTMAKVQGKYYSFRRLKSAKSLIKKEQIEI